LTDEPRFLDPVLLPTDTRHISLESLRSEYHHLMLQLHGGMRADVAFASSQVVK
jgi:hypothetical protein